MDDIYEQEKKTRKIGFFSKKRLARQRRRSVLVDVCSSYIFKRKHTSKRWRNIMRTFSYFLKRYRGLNRGLPPAARTRFTADPILTARRALGSKKTIAERERRGYKKLVFIHFSTRYVRTLTVLNQPYALNTRHLTDRGAPLKSFARWRVSRLRQEYRRRVFARLGFYNRRLGALSLYRGGGGPRVGHKHDVHSVVERQRALQQFFQFRTLSQFAFFVRRHVVRRSPGNLGLEGVLLGLVYKTGLTACTRASYLLARAGAFSINGIRTTNPYKILSVEDYFTVTPIILRAVRRDLFWRLKHKQGLILGPPAYLYADYRVFYFGVTRAPYP